jgi:hypothetical protein
MGRRQRNEIRGCRAQDVFGISRAPGFAVADEILFRAVGISTIADSHYSAGDLDEQFCGGFRTGKILAIGDVTCADENCSFVHRGGGRERNCGQWGKGYEQDSGDRQARAQQRFVHSTFRFIHDDGANRQIKARNLNTLISIFDRALQHEVVN